MDEIRQIPYINTFIQEPFYSSIGLLPPSETNRYSMQLIRSVCNQRLNGIGVTTAVVRSQDHHNIVPEVSVPEACAFLTQEQTRKDYDERLHVRLEVMRPCKLMK